MKVRDVMRLLHMDGWAEVRTRGSHRQFKHHSKPGRVTVPGKPNDDLSIERCGSRHEILVKDRLAPYKYPRWIEFVAELPRTSTGKIQRYKLRAVGGQRRPPAPGGDA